MKSDLKQIGSNLFFRLTLLFILLGSVPFLIMTKGDFVKWTNQTIANDFLDPVFMNITHLGDGWVWLFVAIILLFVRYSHAIVAAVTALFNLLLTGLFKQVLFKGMQRPTAWFADGTFEHLIEGFKYHSSNTFPSGHTMTAFAAAFMISYAFKNKTISIIAFTLAILAGFSRIYLLLHFYVDVYFGAILGLVCLFLALMISSALKINEKEVLSGNLTNMFSR